MTTIPVLWVSKHPEILARGYADQGLVEAILDRSLWSPPGALDFVHHEVRGDFPKVGGAVVIINARTHAEYADVKWFRRQLQTLDWCVLLLCGDEEWSFPWRDIPETPTRKVWVMQARPEHHALGKLPGGWYPQTRELIVAGATAERWIGGEGRSLDWFFAGQVTHQRRQECATVLRSLPHVPSLLVETTRYLEEGIPKGEYFEMMAHAKVVPCPSGPYSVDCARTFEALEAGCIPVADVRTAFAGAFDYWALLYGEEPLFPRISEWSDFPYILEGLLDQWCWKSNRVYAQWQQFKRRLAHQLHDDIRLVAGQAVHRGTPDDRITVIVTTSPSVLHPSTEIVEQTIESIREQLPRAEIVVVADGVRPEQEHLRDNYNEYLRRLLWMTNFRWTNVVPIVLDEWKHQANATKAALELVTTPMILFVEHDTPILGEIDWDGLTANITQGQANVIRLHQDVSIHPDHERVMLSGVEEVFGVPMRKTAAWWQRPHLANAHFYRNLLNSFFSPSARTMIEDRVYSEMWIACDERGQWDRWKVWIYTPEGGDIRRSGHLDGRRGEPKFPMDFGT